MQQENADLRTKVLEYEAELETKAQKIDLKELKILSLQHSKDEQGV